MSKPLQPFSSHQLQHTHGVSFLPYDCIDFVHKQHSHFTNTKSFSKVIENWEIDRLTTYSLFTGMIPVHYHYYWWYTDISQNIEGILPVRLLLYMFFTNLGQAATLLLKCAVLSSALEHRQMASTSKSHRVSPAKKCIAAGYNSYYRACKELVFFRIPLEQTQ